MRPDLEAFRAGVEALGVAGPLAVVGGAALLTLVFTPRWALVLAGAAVFGPVWGTLYAITGAMLGATFAFMVGAAIGRDRLARLTGRRWRRMHDWLRQRGFTSVLYARLLPMSPFGLLNYVFGAAGVPLRVFLPATLLGIAPSTVAYGVLGGTAMTSAPGLAAVAAVALLPLAWRLLRGSAATELFRRTGAALARSRRLPR